MRLGTVSKYVSYSYIFPQPRKLEARYSLFGLLKHLARAISLRDFTTRPLRNHLEMVVPVHALFSLIALLVPAAETRLQSPHHPLRALARPLKVAGPRPQPQRGQLACHEQRDFLAPCEVGGQAWEPSLCVDGILATNGLEEGDQVNVVGFPGAVDDVVDWR